MKLGIPIIIIGITLIIISLIFAYFSASNLEHNVTAFNIISSIVSLLKVEAIAIALFVVGGLMVIFGIKKS